MNQDKKVSVLVCGDVLGKFKSLFNRVSKLCEANKSFQALYCVGSFFGDDNSQWELVKSGKFKVPITCYILGACKSEHTSYYTCHGGGELAPNIIYLGRKGILSSISGMKIAYVSGVEGITGQHTFTAKDITELQDSFQNLGLRGVDFLLTSPWPKYVTKNVPTPAQFEDKTGSELIGYLAAALKPCYHFAGLEGVFMERPPYRNTKTFSNKTSHFTRFIGLAEISNSQGMQYVYGINHCPLVYVSERELMDQKLNEVNTECPYHISETDILQKKQAVIAGKPQSSNKLKQQSKKVFQDCWFCLSCPVEKHLLISVGQHCYVSLAKGWLTPNHFLIVSNTHRSSTVALIEDELKELSNYKYIIKEYFHSIEKNVIFFERNYKSPHLQIQVIAIPKDLNPSAEQVFVKAAAENNILLEEIPPDSVMKQVVGAKKSFFCLEIECKNKRPKKYLHIIEDDFPIQFPREVLGSKSILNVPHRINWRDCTSNEADDNTLCQKFRRLFRNTLSVYHN